MFGSCLHPQLLCYLSLKTQHKGNTVKKINDLGTHKSLRTTLFVFMSVNLVFLS